MKQYIENEDDSSSEESTSQNNCPNLIREIIKKTITAKDGYDIYIEYPRYSCKDIKEKSMKGNIGCCGNIKWCDKKLKKDNKKGENEKDSKIASEIKKVKKKQKENNKGE